MNTIKGWAFNGTSHKRHYFASYLSACGRWRAFGKLKYELVLPDDPKNCAACRMKLEQSHEKSVQAPANTNPVQPTFHVERRQET